MPIAFDATASASGNSVTSLSWSHTCSGSDRALVVFLGGQVVDNAFIGATYDGVIMTPVRITSRNIPADIWAWFLVNPTIGTHTVSVSAWVANAAIGASVSFTGVDARARYGADGGTTGSSTTPSASVTVVSGEVVVAAMVDGVPSQTVTPGGSQTQVVNVTTPNGFYGLAATYSTVTINTWTVGGSVGWATVGVALKPVGASGNPPVPAKTIYEANMAQYGISNYNTVASKYNDWTSGVCTTAGSGTITSSGTTVTFSMSQTGLLQHFICAQSQSREIVGGSGTSWIIASAFSPDISSPASWTVGDQPEQFATNHDYYDGVEVYRQVGEYLATPSPYYDGSNKCQDIIVRGYYIANNGGVPGYQHFTRGLWFDYMRNGTVNSKSTVLLLRDHAAFSPSGDVTDPELSRECAYGINAHIMANRLGFAPDGTRRQTLIDAAYGHLDKWCISKTYTCANALGCDSLQTASTFGKFYIQSFMVALTMRALIEDWEETHDARLITNMQAGADFLWTNAWNASTQSMWRENWTADVNANPVVWLNPSPDYAHDLNLLIAPFYAWLGWQLHASSYIDRADLLFQGGVVGAFLANGKQFDQNYTWSPDYLTWRENYFAPGIPAAVRAFMS